MTIEMNNTDGFASAYQTTELTAGGPPILVTGGELSFGVITLPFYEPLNLTPSSLEPSPSQIQERERTQGLLGIEMTEHRLFRQLVERGLADLEQGHYKDFGKATRKSGVL